MSCKRGQIKTRDYMDRRVTPRKQGTLLTWGPSTPHKRALKVLNVHVLRGLTIMRL